MTDITTTYDLPKNTGVYESPHSGERHWRIANDNLALLTQVGSGLHGVTQGEYDDRDEQGVCIEPPSVMLGFDDFRLYEYRSKAMGARSGPGDLDLNVYGLHEWITLITQGNPTHILPLFAPTGEVVFMSTAGKLLRDHRDVFLASSHGHRFLGYLNNQRNRMMGAIAQRTNRPELIKRYGYDTKFAYHACRIALQGIQLMQTHNIVLPMLDEHRAWLGKIRNGEFNKDYVLSRLAELEEMLAQAISASTLPDSIDYRSVNELMTDLYLGWWTSSGLIDDWANVTWRRA